MSTLFSSKSPRSKQMIFAFALMAGSGISAVAVAQSSSQTSPASSQTDEMPANSKAASTDHRLVKPGDRNCLQHTGSLIPPKNGDCLPVAGSAGDSEFDAGNRCVDQLIDLRLGDDVRRHEINHVAQRPQQHAVLQPMQDIRVGRAVLRQGKAAGWSCPRPVRSPRSCRSGVRRRHGMVAQRRQSFRQMSRKLAVAFQHRFVAKDRQRLQCHAAGQRIAGIAVRMQERLAGIVFGVKRLVDRVRSEYGGQRQKAAGEPFRQAQKSGVVSACSQANSVPVRPKPPRFRRR
jgi:hypothetical protein